MCQIELMRIHRRCKNLTDQIAIYIIWKGQQLGLCNNCWNWISDNKRDIEWGDDPKPTLADLLSDKARGLERAIPTEYKGRGKWRIGKNKSKMEDTSSHGDRPIEEEEVQPYSFGDDVPPEEES